MSRVINRVGFNAFNRRLTCSKDEVASDIENHGIIVTKEIIYLCGVISSASSTMIEELYAIRPSIASHSTRVNEAANISIWLALEPFIKTCWIGVKGITLLRSLKLDNHCARRQVAAPLSMVSGVSSSTFDLDHYLLRHADLHRPCRRRRCPHSRLNNNGRS